MDVEGGGQRINTTRGPNTFYARDMRGDVLRGFRRYHVSLILQGCSATTGLSGERHPG